MVESRGGIGIDEPVVGCAGTVVVAFGLAVAAGLEAGFLVEVVVGFGFAAESFFAVSLFAGIGWPWC